MKKLCLIIVIRRGLKTKVVFLFENIFYDCNKLSVYLGPSTHVRTQMGRSRTLSITNTDGRNLIMTSFFNIPVDILAQINEKLPDNRHKIVEKGVVEITDPDTEDRHMYRH